MAESTGKAKKVRLDELLVERGMAPSRSVAKALILAGKVRHGTEVLDKAGKTVPADLALELESGPRFVSRGGEKLEGFLDRFGVDARGKRVLDVGASTGGFTDCLLQRGAVSSVCVDVGYGQLHYQLRQDPRVTNLERINARGLDEVALPQPDYDIVVMDLSFISLTKVLPAVWPRVAHNGGVLIALIKPQFEADKRAVDAGKGVIRDPLVQQETVERVRRFAREHLAGCAEFGLCESPIRGADGNREFLIGWRHAGAPDESARDPEFV